MKTILIVLLTACALGCGGYGSGSGSGSMAPGAPSIAAPLVPNTATAGSAAFTLTVNGSGFVASVGCLLEFHGAYHHIRDQQPAYRGDSGRGRRHAPALCPCS